MLGPVAPGDLGPTLMQEHLVCEIRHSSRRRPEALRFGTAWRIRPPTRRRSLSRPLLLSRSSQRHASDAEMARVRELLRFAIVQPHG